MVELQQASLPAGTTGHLFSHMTHAANVSADKSYCLLFEKGISAPKRKSHPLNPPLPPPQCAPTAMYIRPANKSSDGLFQQ